jgi:serine/threonine protein kinase
MFHSNYNILEEIGKGQFGKVYKAINKNTNEEVAIKIESKKTRLLKREADIYLLLSKEEGFPRVKWYGSTETFYYLVTDLLGVPLTELKNRCDNIPSVIIRRLGKKMIRLVEKVHNYQMLHRDIKPDNFLFDRVNYDEIYLIDFGLAKSYQNIDNTHIIEKDIDEIIGTLPFISLNVHAKKLPSRRDDLESIIYILYYLIIPAEKWPSSNEELFKKNLLETQHVLNEPLNYVRNLGYEETPLYDKLIEMIETI